LALSTLADAPELVLDGMLENTIFSLRFDALIKVPGSSYLGNFHYIPILFHEGPVQPTQRLLLSLLSIAIAQIQERVPATGLIWRSQRVPATLDLLPYLDSARHVMNELSLVQTGASIPPLILNSYCQVCEFRDTCRSQALKEGNLSLLRGISERQITRLNKKGIFTVNQLSYTFRARRAPKRAKKSAAVHHFSLQALAIREKHVFVHGAPTFFCSDNRIYLDIEGGREACSYYLIGIITVANGQISRDAYWADSDNKQEQIRIFQSLLEHLRNYETYSILHFGGYETTALRRMKSHMTEPHQQEIDEALKRCINVLSIIYPHIYFPTYSNNLKEIGGFLGCRWSESLSTGVQSLIWRARWLESHAAHFKAELFEYNYNDCFALKSVVEFIEMALRQRPAAIPSVIDNESIVYTESMRATGKDEWHLFGSKRFALDNFEAINRLAYFDYQHDKVVARHKKSRRKTSARRRKRLQAANKIVKIRAVQCRSCHGRTIMPLSPCVHEVIDLKFSKGGIRRWVVRYMTRRYRCSRCGTRFLPERFLQHRRTPRYGRGLICWCIYQLLVCGQNIYRIHRSLHDLFGLSVPTGAVYDFKHTVALFYRNQYQNLRKSIIAGRLLHIDETGINLLKKKGYVWVMTGTDSVYFFFRTSREGSFLSDMLKKFRGVLVSDFYTAYESIKVSQQRCLIHFMRDMNDDLLKNPFDAELKVITGRFSLLLMAIVNTIDQHGLTRRYLKNHRSEADKFCDFVTETAWTSEVAQGYARRVQKYRSMLFTFLDYDGVPWNNNSPEHAIKSFAKYRRFADGMVTENTINDYLILLSIWVSCEYRGANFLNELLGHNKGGEVNNQRQFTPFRPKLRSPPHGRPVPSALERQMIKDGSILGSETEKYKVLNLNRVLPIILDCVTRSIRGIRFRTAFQVDLWAVKLNPNEFRDALTSITKKFKEMMLRRKTIILAARNVRFDKPDSVSGLIGRYVVISVSHAGDIALTGSSLDSQREIDFSRVYEFMEAIGGVATLMSTRGARNKMTTILRLYMPQYSSDQPQRRTRRVRLPVRA